MSYWNYRIRQTDADVYGFGPVTSFDIIEAYYNEADELQAWAVARPGGDNVEELAGDLEMMADALKLPVLNNRDLPQPAPCSGCAGGACKVN